MAARWTVEGNRLMLYDGKPAFYITKPASGGLSQNALTLVSQRLPALLNSWDGGGPPPPNNPSQDAPIEGLPGWEKVAVGLWRIPVPKGFLYLAERGEDGAAMAFVPSGG